MSKISKVLTAVAVLPVLAFATTAHAATGGNGQIEQGDIYRAKDVTTNSAFADNINAICGDTVQFRVRVHNGGPETLTNVNVAATLDQSSSTKSHGSQVSVSADNNLHGAVVTANAGVNTDKATTATYVSGSTQLLNYSTTPGNESVLRNLPDGILSTGVNIGSIGPLTSDTEEVQFQAKLSCPQPLAPVFSCDAFNIVADVNRTVKVSAFSTTATNGAAFNDAVLTWGDSSAPLTTKNVVGQAHQYAADGTYTVTATAHFTVNGQGDVTASGPQCQKQVTFTTNTPPKVTPPATPATPAAPTALVNTGPGSVMGLFAVTTAIGAVAHRWMLGRRLSRQ